MPASQSPSGAEAPRPFAPRRAAQAFDHERVLRALDRIRRQRAFASETEACLQLSAFGGRRVEDLQDAAGHDAQEDAQELAFQAMESQGAPAAALARRALTLDPHCADALVLLTGHSPDSEREAGLRAAVAATQAGLTALAGQESLCNLWACAEARPGLRARAALAEWLERQGRMREAAEQWQERLNLDVPDTQGCRFRLLRCYFALNARKPLQDLLHIYREDHGPVLAWARVLERLHAHSPVRAEQLLKKARAANAHVEAYLTGRARLPKGNPSLPLAPGSLEEAQVVLAYLGNAWGADREAMSWLFNQEK